MRDSSGFAAVGSLGAAGVAGAAGSAGAADSAGVPDAAAALRSGLLGPLAKVFGDLGHGVTSRCITDLQRTGDAAILANPPEVDGHEDDGDEREHEDVEHVPAQQRLGTDLDAAEQHESDLVAEHR